MINSEKKNGFFRKITEKILRGIYNSRLLKPFRKYIDALRKKIEKSIRFELMVVIGVCFIISFLFYGFLNGIMRQEKTSANITYNYNSIEVKARDFVSNIQSDANKSIEAEEVKNMFTYYGDSRKVYLTDLDGNVLLKSQNVSEDKVDIFAVMSTTTNIDADMNKGKEIKYIYPVSLGQNKYYLVYSDVPEAVIKYDNYTVTNSFLALILSCSIFIIIFIIITNRKMKYMDQIADGLKRIAKGDFNHKIPEIGNDEIGNLATNINIMSTEISNKIEAERNAEKTKADLITNVSHDLRTPLTSIMGYIGLVKDGRYEDEKTMKEYLEISFNKAEKLKSLIEDLFEYTKLNNDGIKINKCNVNISGFLFQLVDELTPIFDENNISIIKSVSNEKIMVNVDPDKMVRVFENLLTNAVKYSYKPGNIVVGIYENEDYVTVAIRNKGKNIPPEKVAKLFERFYRVDESRNAQSGGSGLGLAISKNIVEMHGGQIWAECYGEDISFYVKLKCIKN